MEKAVKLFDKKFVHFMWDDKLKGKEGFFADSIDVLNSYIEDCNDNRVGKVSVSNRSDFPFRNSCSGMYRFFYCDPNYEVKRAFYKEGKTVQYFDEVSAQWLDIFKEFDVIWYDKRGYRVKPEEEKQKRMTYRQLAEWLARGKGQQTSTDCTVRYTFQEVLESEENKEIPENYKIRYWGSDEWIEPTEREYLVSVKHINPDMSPAEYHYQETDV